MKHVDRMVDCIFRMKKKNVYIVVFTETHFDHHDCKEFHSIARKSGYKAFSVMRLMKRGDRGSGGVTIMVDERVKCRKIRESKLEDLLWVCIELEQERMFVGGTYLVPHTSSRARKANELVEEIGRDVTRFCLEGQVILVGDWNCKIGQMSSVAQEKTYGRKSVPDNVDYRGRRMIEMLNLSDMIVLNGVQTKSAQYTCSGVNGDGIDDYIAVSSALFERTSELEYWEDEARESDHVAIGCRIKMKKEVILKEIERKKKKNFDYKILCENKSWKFWYKLVDFCEEEMEKTVALMAGIQDVEECWQVLKKDIVGVLEWGRKRVRRKEQEDEEKGMKEIKKELEKLKREKRKANVEQVRFKTLKNRIEKLRKKIRKMRMRKKIDSILACDKEEKKNTGSC